MLAVSLLPEAHFFEGVFWLMRELPVPHVSGTRRAQSIAPGSRFPNTAPFVVTYDQTTGKLTVTVGQDPRAIPLAIVDRLSAALQGSKIFL
jgi:hypothetical protein